MTKSTIAAIVFASFVSTGANAAFDMDLKASATFSHEMVEICVIEIDDTGAEYVHANQDYTNFQHATITSNSNVGYGNITIKAHELSGTGTLAALNASSYVNGITNDGGVGGAEVIMESQYNYTVSSGTALWLRDANKDEGYYGVGSGTVTQTYKVECVN